MNSLTISEAMTVGLAAIRLLKNLGVTARELTQIVNSEISEEELLQKLKQRQSSIEERINN